MRRLIFGAAALLLTVAASPNPPAPVFNLNSSTVTANGGNTAQTLANSQAAPGVDASYFGAQGDALSYTDGTIAAASSAFTSNSATFTSADVGKRICVQGSGTSGVTQCGTISAFTNAHAVTVSFTSVQATPWYSVAGAPLVVATDQNGAGSYAPGDTITLTGGTASSQAQLSVYSTEVASATVNAGGTGGNSGACTVTGTTGTGILFTATGTVTGGALTGPLTVTTRGIYTVNPTSLVAEPVTGCSLTGATLTLNMGVHRVTLVSGGHYSMFPSNPVLQGSTSGSGTGFQLTATQAQSGSGDIGGGVFVYGTDDTAAITSALASSAGTIYLNGTKGYLINGSLSPQSGHALVGRNGRPVLYQTSGATARTLLLNGTTNALVSGLQINNFGSTTDYLILINGGASGNVLSDFVIPNGPNFSTGTVLISNSGTSNRLSQFVMTGNAGTCVGLTGAAVQYNTVEDLQVTDCGGFGVRIGEGANRNTVSRARTTRNGIELVGVTFGSDYNLVSNSYAQGTGDNGFSFSSSYNTVTGNRAYQNMKAGFGVWGSFNALAGNVSLDNNQIGDVSSSKWSGYWVDNGNGGCGSYNQIGGTADDDQAQRTQTYGVLFGGNAYAAWAQGQTISSTGVYRFNGVNIYTSASTGTTGATAPTCTSGTCSDGAVTWTYVNSCIQQVSPHDNVGTATVARSQSGTPFADSSAWSLNGAYGNRQMAVPPVSSIYIQFRGLPTSSSGLGSGTIWNNANVLNIVP